MVPMMHAAVLLTALLTPTTSPTAGDGYLGLQLKAGPDGKGAVVILTLEDSPAAKAGVKADDLIIKVNGEDVGQLADFVQRIQNTKSGARLLLAVKRGGQ